MTPQPTCEWCGQPRALSPEERAAGSGDETFGPDGQRLTWVGVDILHPTAAPGVYTRERHFFDSDGCKRAWFAYHEATKH